MADKTIGSLPAATTLNDPSLLVVEQEGAARKLTGLLLKQYCQNAVAAQVAQADTSAEDAEAWSVGKRNGADVPSTDPAYHNNAKYYASQGRALGLTGATVGQIPVVKTVDASGVPTEWEAGDSKPFVVTVTYGDNYTLTADKTHAEIVAAYAAGVQINAKIVNHPIFMAPIILPLFINISDEMFAFGGSGITDGSATAMTAIDTNGSWRVELAELATPDDIPTEVLTVNLAMNDNGTIIADKTFAEIKAAYDAGKVVNAKFADAIVPLSSLTDLDALFAQTNANSRGIITYSLSCTSDDVWSMSEDGFAAYSLGLTGATVGQVPVVNSVDGNGVPNGWVAGDLPSGGSGGSVIEIASGVDVSAVSSFTYSTDINGNQLKCNRFRIMLLAPNLTDKEAAWLQIEVNGVLLNVYNYKNKVWLADVIVHPSYIEYILSSNRVAVTTGNIYAESSANKIENIFLVSASTDNTNSNKTINCKFNYGINDPAWGDGAMLWIWGI